WSDLRGARVGVWGLGVEGTANLARLRTLGVEPVLVDDRPPPGDVDGLQVFATGDSGLAALRHCDVVVKSPGISRYREDLRGLEGRGIPVVGGLGLWMQEAPRERVICVTGTKGKSSTTAIAGHLLTRLGYSCLTGGNIGAPPWDPALDAAGYDYWVIETSSYQATDLASSPPVVAVTSLHPDHLDWHGGVENYYRDKLSACSQPGADVTIANGDSELLRERAARLGPRVRWVHADDDPGADWMAPLGLLGSHNRRNALIARNCLLALGVREATDDAALAEAAAGFEHLSSRLTVLGEVAGVTFVDDSLSTNVLPTLAALDAFPGRRVALIAGGHDRGIDYEPLAAGLAPREAPTLVLTLPDSGPRIEAAINDQIRNGSAGHPGASGPALLRVTPCPDLDAAVAAGFDWARPDGVLLLSPAAPSFGIFRNYRDRAEAFGRAMRDCATRSGAA
ncbi:MAG TPA: UDP-N-acetylmuramoyl-L-alanine--D-glutamate ligase, partial [Streptosporangiaceae bacterium]